MVQRAWLEHGELTRHKMIDGCAICDKGQPFVTLHRQGDGPRAHHCGITELYDAQSLATFRGRSQKPAKPVEIPVTRTHPVVGRVARVGGGRGSGTPASERGGCRRRWSHTTESRDIACGEPIFFLPNPLAGSSRGRRRRRHHDHL